MSKEARAMENSILPPKIRARAANRKKKNEHFNIKETLKLIECVQKRPTLWDRRYLRKRSSAGSGDWEQIQQESFASLTIDQLKIRWKTLRDSFRRETKRIDNGVASASRWPLYEHMQFLLGHYRIKPSVRRMDTTEHKSNSKRHVLTLASPSRSQEQLTAGPASATTVSNILVIDVPHLSDVVYQNNDTQEAPNGLDLSCGYKESKPSLVESQQPKDSINGSELDEDMSDGHEVTYRNKFRSRVRTVSSTVGENCTGGTHNMDDPDIAFLASLAPYLRALSVDKNLQVRIQMLKLAMNAISDDKSKYREKICTM